MLGKGGSKKDGLREKEVLRTLAEPARRGRRHARHGMIAAADSDGERREMMGKGPHPLVGAVPGADSGVAPVQQIRESPIRRFADSTIARCNPPPILFLHQSLCHIRNRILRSINNPPDVEGVKIV